MDICILDTAFSTFLQLFSQILMGRHLCVMWVHFPSYFPRLSDWLKRKKLCKNSHVNWVVGNRSCLFQSFQMGGSTSQVIQCVSWAFFDFNPCPNEDPRIHLYCRSEKQMVFLTTEEHVVSNSQKPFYEHIQQSDPLNQTSKI